MKNIFTCLLISILVLLSGCFNLATGNAKISHIIAPITASSAENPASITESQVNEQQEEWVSEEVYEETPPIPFLPIDF